MSTQFKAGDRALFSGEVPGTNHWYHSPVEVQIKEVHGNYVEAVFPDKKISWSVWVNQLTPIDQHKFKVGDRVRVVRNEGAETMRWTVGLCGTITQIGGDSGYSRFTHMVKLDYQDAKCFTPTELELISPQSPQPQTQKPKEDDMKRYAVIYKNMASNEAPNINSTHATEAEAKLAGEQIVAGQRQELVKKNFFSVSILDTHTGTLIGSVVDAPPAVEWNAGK